MGSAAMLLTDVGRQSRDILTAARLVGIPSRVAMGFRKVRLTRPMLASILHTSVWALVGG